MLISCICGGLEFIILGIACAIPLIAKKLVKVCKRNCKCECHNNKEHKMNEAPVMNCNCRMCESARAAKT